MIENLIVGVHLCDSQTMPSVGIEDEIVLIDDNDHDFLTTSIV